MALGTPTTLTSGGASAATSHTTASVTSSTDGLLLLTVHLYVGSGSTQPVAPTVTGLSRTWTQVGTDVIVDNSGTDRATMFLFRAMGAGATGTLTITPSSSMKATWILQQVTGADTSGTEGSGAIVTGSFVETELASVSAITTTSPALSASTNMLYGGVGSQSVVARTWGNSWTKSAEVTTNSVTYAGVGYFVGPGQLTQSVTWTTAGRSGAYAVEIKEASAVGTVTATRATTWRVWQNAGTLPGTIPEVEPETHAHNPSIMVGGALYRVMESDLASGNHPAMYKSLDGGSTWAEVNSGSRPSATDLEGVWTLLANDGTTILVYVNRDDQAWRVPFDTTTDTWGTQESIKSGMSSSGVEQYVSAAVLSNGDEWIAYSNTLSGSNNQAAVRKRTGASTYGTEIDLGGNTAISWTGPVLVKGASDVTHVFLKDSTNHRLYWRTLSSTGTLSAATRIDTAGTSDDNIAHTNAVYFDDAGTETVGILYTDTGDVLRYVRIVGGVAQSPEQASSTAVLMDPGFATNGGTVAHLANDGTTVYAAWARASDGSVLYRSRPVGGSWGTETVVVPFTVDALDFAEYVYIAVHQYPPQLRSGAKVLGVVYDIGEHANDVSNMRYTEVELVTLASVTATRATTWTTRAEVTDTRASTWTTRAEVTGTRASTWTARSSVTATRGTSWTVATPVTASRSTTWAARTSVTATRATSWTATASVTATRATTWTAHASVTATRSTTWDVSSTVPTTTVTAARSTSWTAAATVQATRATTWTARATVTASRGTTWTAHATVTSSRASTWTTRTAVTATRATTWETNGNLLAVTATRSTTWGVIGRITSSRSTTWTALATTTATRATSWDARATVGASRLTTWTVCRSVAPATRSTTWATLQKVQGVRATTWALESLVPQRDLDLTFSLAGDRYGMTTDGDRYHAHLSPDRYHLEATP